MWQQLLGSKKVWLTVAAVLAWILGRFGLDIPAADLEPVVLSIVALVVAQGWADTGKEAAKVQAAKSNGTPLQ